MAEENNAMAILPPAPPAPSTDAPAEAKESANPQTSGEKTVEQQMRERLDALMGVDAEPKAAPATSEPVSEPEPKPEAKQEASEKPEEPAEANGKAKADAEAQATDDPKVEPEKLAKARNALKRWKYPDDVLQGLPDERILELGDAAMKQQAEQDRIGNEKRDEKKRREELENLLADIEREKQGKSESKDQPQAKSDDPAAEEDPFSADAIIEALEYDESLVPLVDSLKKAFSTERARYQSALEELKAQNEAKDQRVNHVYESMDRILLNQSRLELQEEYPQLRDAEKFKAATSRVYQLANLPGYRDENGVPDMTKLLSDAARLEFGTETKAQLQAKLTEKYKKQSEGQPTSKTNRAQPIVGLSDDDRMRQAYSLLQQGKAAKDIPSILASSSAA